MLVDLKTLLNREIGRPSRNQTQKLEQIYNLLWDNFARIDVDVVNKIVRRKFIPKGRNVTDDDHIVGMLDHFLTILMRETKLTMIDEKTAEWMLEHSCEYGIMHEPEDVRIKIYADCDKRSLLSDEEVKGVLQLIGGSGSTESRPGGRVKLDNMDIGLCLALMKETSTWNRWQWNDVGEFVDDVLRSTYAGDVIFAAGYAIPSMYYMRPSETRSKEMAAVDLLDRCNIEKITKDEPDKICAYMNAVMLLVEHYDCIGEVERHVRQMEATLRMRCRTLFKVGSRLPNDVILPILQVWRKTPTEMERLLSKKDSSRAVRSLLMTFTKIMSRGLENPREKTIVGLVPAILANYKLFISADPSWWTWWPLIRRAMFMTDDMKVNLSADVRARLKDSAQVLREIHPDFRIVPDDNRVDWGNEDEAWMACRETCSNIDCLNLESNTELGMELKACGGCKVARYCSVACQEHDWVAGGHRHRCLTPLAALDMP